MLVNTGYCNSGDYNSGNYNSGNYNSGNYNSGNYNSGDCNSGDYNSGDYNSGNYNSGDCNSGNCNSGYCNSGDCNSGNCNSGNCNSGNYNSGYRNSGFFNTEEPNKIMLFNKWVDMSYTDFIGKYDLSVELPINSWVCNEDLPEEEQTKETREMDGKLVTLSYKEAWKKWWEEHEDDHSKFLELPNFDAEIFKEITGIDIEEKEEEMTMEEVCKELGRTIKIKK